MEGSKVCKHCNYMYRDYCQCHGAIAERGATRVAERLDRLARAEALLREAQSWIARKQPGAITDCMVRPDDATILARIQQFNEESRREE